MTQLRSENEDDHGLSAYLHAFKKAQKGLNEPSRPPESKDAPVDDGEPDQPVGNAPASNNSEAQEQRGPGVPKILVLDENSELITPVRLGESLEPPKSFAEIDRRRASQNDDLEVEIANLVDDAYSEAEQSFMETQSRRGRPSWYRKRAGYESDSEKGDKGPKPDPNDETYDSDLDSETSRDREGVRRATREHAKKMRVFRSLATNRFENMLLECIVNTDSIPPKYQNIYVNPATIRELERVTRLSLDKPKAFSRGVLKGNRVTGAILWGPPGTGKTILAKGLAKESKCNMLSISTAELWQKCHGEDEKVIKAVFSLGRKLFPCIVFLDEADAMLGARKAGEKRHIRSMLNQFLMEWDGLTSGMDSPFILLATNRPFDLDPAVLRRAPVRVQIDIPTMWEREQILALLLEGEELEEGCKPSNIASLTHKYTGSDLKNLCVTAATLCVDAQPCDTDQRVLTTDHFLEARKSVRPTQLNSTMRNEFRKFEGKKDMDTGRRGHRDRHDEDDD
ncbi:putative mitochondrial AAA [Chaetomidium leptoderma]|uniref:Mitochondrial AAA n=1 Tax=Chaetomidium leptoderma TaxID=669021 RepID=A0AAN7A2Y3_9PEZI|nr:putative mitochondrial AAA [Chaetomidium leptoderma]